MLNILEGYDIASMGFGSAEYIHLFTEAKKLAFEDRAKYYADPVFSKVPVSQLISKNMLQKDVNLLIRKKQPRFMIAGRLKLEIQFILQLPTNLAIWFR